jgi:hypothetical protein
MRTDPSCGGLLQLVNRLLRRQWLLQTQSYHFPGEGAVDIAHTHVDVAVEVEVVDCAVWRVPVEMPSVHVPAAGDADGWVRDGEVRRRSRALVRLRLCRSVNRDGQRLGPIGAGGRAVLGLEESLYLLCTWGLELLCALGVSAEVLHTQSLLQGLHVPSLRATLPSHFVVRASVAKARAGAAARLEPVTLQLPLPTDHTREALRLRDARIASGGGLGRVVIGIEVVGGVRHHDGV